MLTTLCSRYLSSITRCFNGMWLYNMVLRMPQLEGSLAIRAICAALWAPDKYTYAINPLLSSWN